MLGDSVGSVSFCVFLMQNWLIGIHFGGVCLVNTGNGIVRGRSRGIIWFIASIGGGVLQIVDVNPVERDILLDVAVDFVNDCVLLMRKLLFGIFFVGFV